jgi:hypothetical protein
MDNSTNTTCTISYELANSSLYISLMTLYLFLMLISFMASTTLVCLIVHIKIMDDVVKITLFNFAFGLQLNTIGSAVAQILQFYKLLNYSDCALEVEKNNFFNNKTEIR